MTKIFVFTAPGTYTRCGRDFLNRKSGSFQSPSYPKLYPSEAHCTWNITVRAGKYVQVNFYDVNMENIGKIFLKCNHFFHRKVFVPLL